MAHVDIIYVEKINQNVINVCRIYIKYINITLRTLMYTIQV